MPDRRRIVDFEQEPLGPRLRSIKHSDQAALGRLRPPTDPIRCPSTAVRWGPSASGPVDDQRTLDGMDGLGTSVGNGVTSLVGGAFDAIGAALRGIVNAGEQALPGGLFWALIFVVLVATGWTLAKR